MGIYGVSFTGTKIYPFGVWFLVTAAVMAVCYCSIFKIRRLNVSDAVRSGAWKAEGRAGKPAGDATADTWDIFYSPHMYNRLSDPAPIRL